MEASVGAEEPGPSMTEFDATGKAAELLAALESSAAETQQAFRYVCAQVGLRLGLLEPVGYEMRATGNRVICRERSTGKFLQADRPPEWSANEEAYWVEKMMALLRPESPE